MKTLDASDLNAWRCIGGLFGVIVCLGLGGVVLEGGAGLPAVVVILGLALPATVPLMAWGLGRVAMELFGT